jgi:hypothetical protein
MRFDESLKTNPDTEVSTNPKALAERGTKVDVTASGPTDRASLGGLPPDLWEKAELAGYNMRGLTVLNFEIPPEVTPVETSSAELEDGTQIEIIEDPQDSSKSQLAVFKDSEVRLVNRFESGNRAFVPIPRDTNLLRYRKELCEV